ALEVADALVDGVLDLLDQGVVACHGLVVVLVLVGGAGEGLGGGAGAGGGGGGAEGRGGGEGPGEGGGAHRGPPGRDGTDGPVHSDAGAPACQGQRRRGLNHGDTETRGRRIDLPPSLLRVSVVQGLLQYLMSNAAACLRSSASTCSSKPSLPP